MKVKNPSSTVAVNVHDSLSNDLQVQYQRGIKDVTVATSGTVTVNNTSAGDSAALQSQLNSGALILNGPDAAVTVVGPVDTTVDVTITKGIDDTPAAVTVPASAVPGVVSGFGKAIYMNVFRNNTGASLVYRIALTPKVTGTNTPDLALLGHVNPNDVNAQVPVIVAGFVATSVPMATAPTVAWTVATSSTAGDASCMVTITVEDNETAGVTIYG